MRLIFLLFFGTVLCDKMSENDWYNLHKSTLKEEKLVNTQGIEIVWKFSVVKYLKSILIAVPDPPCYESDKSLAIKRYEAFGLNINYIENCIVPKMNKKCPDDLLEIETKNEIICISISPKAESFEKTISQCHGSDKTIFDIDNLFVLENYLNSINITRFWLPIQRINRNIYNPLVWQLPGDNWNDPFDTFKYDELSMHNCLTIQLKNGKIESLMTNCSDLYHSICVFNKKPIIASACPKPNFKALSYNPTKCIGLSYGQEAHTEIITLQNMFLMKNTINIILDNIKKDIDIETKKYVVQYYDSLVNIYLDFYVPIKQKNYSVELSLDYDKFKYPYLYEITLEKPITKPIIMLLKKDGDKLVLTVYNRLFIWKLDDHEEEFGIKCFTNTNYDILEPVDIEKLIWENDDQSKSIFELKLDNDIPGYYWCEAHSIFDFDLIASQKVIAVKKQKGHPFTFFYRINCNQMDCFKMQIFNNMKKLSKSIEKLIEKQTDKKEFKDLKIHNVQIMNIEDYVVGKYLTVLCQATVSLESSAVDNSSEESSEEEDEEENNLGIRHDTSIRVKAMNLLNNIIKTINYGHESSINSTEFCFPEFLNGTGNSKNHWMIARLGETSTTKDLCLQKNGLPIIRKCIGDFLYGAIWETMSNIKIECIDITMTVQELITNDLYQIVRSKQAKLEPEKVIQNVKGMLSSSIEKIIPADLFYLSKILKSISNQIISSIKDFTNSTSNSIVTVTKFPVSNITTATSDIVEIYNNLMNLNGTIISPSIELNSTNILLDSFEKLIDEISIDRNYSENDFAKAKSIVGNNQVEGVVGNYIYDNDGVLVKIAQNLIIFVIDPSVTNISGIAFYQNGSLSKNFERGQFRGEQYRFLSANQSSTLLLEEKGLLLATFVPETLLDRLDEIRLTNTTTNDQILPPKIVVKIYANDLLFQEEQINLNKHKSLGHIISISIPGHSRYLPEVLPLILHIADTENRKKNSSCGYWNFKTWANDGVSLLRKSPINDNLLLCGCTHLTPFGILVGIQDYTILQNTDLTIRTLIHNNALDLITIFGCSLSLFGIFGIFITAIVFQSWRQKKSSKVLLQLSAAIALQMILFCFVNTKDITLHLLENQIFASCVLLGASLQYSVLVQFSWMIIIAYLQYKRYVKVFGSSNPKRFFLKSFLLGWGLPLVPVLLVIFIDRKSYIPESDLKICYPSGKSLYFGIILPIVLVIIANLAIFIMIVYNIIKGPDSSIRHTNEKRQAMAQVRVSILLFFLLGITWIFGLLSAMKAGFIFSYLFCLTATLQGFVLFVYFIILDPHTRNLWFDYLSTLCSEKETENTMISNLSNKTSL